MKRLLSILSVALAIMATSCETGKNAVKSISVQVSIDESELSDVASPESYTVTLTNVSNGQAVTVETENGVAVAEGIIPGVYNVVASAISISGGFTFTLSGSASNVSFLNEGDNATIKVMAVKESALVFKEIYYTGAPGENYYFRDQFYEIYNNSDETVYADGLCIAETVFSNYDFSIVYQWDIPDSDKYVFAQIIWQLPGSGTDYPIAPGESFVIAQWATNHKDESLSAGESKVDLSGAEFEAFCGESTTWTGITLTDEPALNMTKAVNATGYDTPQWLTSVGGSRYVLFKPSTPLRTDNFIVATNAESTTEAHEILITDVIDAVQAISDQTQLQTLGLPSVLDAGAIWCSGSYVGESIARKVKETLEDGRVIYQDTNNTTEDFEVQTTPTVRRNGAGVPSWNTWIK